MTLEQLVTDLATSQQLKAAGFPQDTAMAWVGEHEYDFEAQQFDGCHIALIRRDAIAHEHEVICAAPTAGELMEWLKNLAPECAGPAVRWEPECWMADFDHEEDAGEHAVEDTLIAALAALVLEVAG